jgi:hypothetical protein
MIPASIATLEAQIFLDGVMLSRVITVDEEAGTARPRSLHRPFKEKDRADHKQDRQRRRGRARQLESGESDGRPESKTAAQQQRDR